MIFRNDDVSYKTEVSQFEEVHKLFKKYTVLHTIALICRGIEKNPELIKYINDNNIDVQVHCWDHRELTRNPKATDEELKLCIETITTHFKHRPITLYPPWNKSNEQLETICALNGLTVSTQKISLSQYIRLNGQVREKVINFHSWAVPDILILEDALKLYSERR